jgi:thiol-disulfide isomerase/thioredoxin
MRLTRTCLLTVLLILVASAASAQQMALAPGDRAPALMGWDLEGKLQKVEWKGLTLLNFWATWCQPCRTEMPVLQELLARHREKGFRVIGMNKDSDASIEAMQEFLEEVPVDYPILKPDLKTPWNDVLVVPTSFLIDGEGKILRKYVGATPEQIEGLERDVDNVLHGRPMGPMPMPGPSGPEDSQD